MSASFIIPDWPAPPHVQSCVTTREGGVSVGAWAGLNLATHVGDDAAHVAANRVQLRQSLPAEPVWLNQVHGVECVNAEQVVANCCAEISADASMSVTPDTVCAVMTADCLPVLFCNQAGTVVAAAHAGWRGLLACVLENTVRHMRCPATEVLAWLGPAIGAKQFEVGAEVRAAFVAQAPSAAAAFSPHGEKWLCDIYALSRQRLASVGVNAVYGGDFCTVSDAQRFYSYRRDGVTGRMASLIWIGQNKTA